MLYNIFLADLFFILNKTEIANYADDNKLYTRFHNINGLIKSLEEASNEFFKWSDNPMKSNPAKCHLLVSTNNDNAMRKGSSQIENTKRQILLGIQFDRRLSFDYHEFLFQIF